VLPGHLFITLFFFLGETRGVKKPPLARFTSSWVAAVFARDFEQHSRLIQLRGLKPLTGAPQGFPGLLQTCCPTPCCAADAHSGKAAQIS